MIRASRATNTSRLRVAVATALVGAAVMLVPTASPAAAATGDLVISGVVDGPLTGGTPKAVELFAVNDIADLSVYGIGSANNGGGSDGEEFTFPSDSATAGEYIYVASEAPNFTAFFGFGPNYTSGAANINGDDAIELFRNGAVVDVFGDIDTDGTGEPWEHLDGWAYRVDDTGQDGSTFDLANWTFSGPDALDGETTNDTAATPFPIGTYAATGVTPVNLLISGVVDGPLSGGVPKAIEFFVLADIADLSIYGFGSANNGGGSDGEEFTFPAVAATAGDVIHVASEVPGFTTFFGFAPDYTSGAASINGDDAIELFQNGAVVDVFGDIDTDGNGEPWEYLDGWAYRADATGPDGSTFELGNWTFSGPDALDGAATNDTAANPFPIGTYSTTVAPTVDLVINGVVDADLPGGLPKMVEFYAVNDIADLSVYGFGSANNGGGSDGEEFTFPSDSAAAGDYIYVASEVPNFTAFFGFAPNYTSGAANINGDDAIELFQNGAVVDVFGDIDTDGTGQPWEYTDGWAKRVDGTGPDGSTFVLGNWTFSGVGALDGETTNATAAIPFPLDIAAPVDLLITGVVDGPLSGGTPKAVEFYAVNDIADLSVYGFGSANNGGGSDGEEFTFPAVPASAGDSIHVASEVPNFTTFFGFAPDYTSGAANINGDDAIELFQNGAVVDVFGDINVDGSGQPWEYTDGWAYRVDATGPDGSTFVLANWTFSGPDALDGETSNDTAAVPFPIGTYSTSPFVPLSFIHEVQGSGPSVAITGTVKVDAIVTSLVENDDVLSGFLLQEEDADADLDPNTSEGILVTCDAVCPPTLAVGDNVAVMGEAGELFDMSEIDASAGGSVTINTSGNPLPKATPQALPAPDGTDEELTFEPLEGMLVEFTDELFVSEYFELARFGQVVLTVDERPYQFTHENLPSVAGYTAFLDDLATRRIVLDDDNNNQNDAIFGPDADEPYYYPVPGFSTDNRFRGGDSITNLTGALDWAFGEWRVNPTPEVFPYQFTPNNARPAAPDAVGGSLKVASFNVLNYFTTIDDGVNTCGPSNIGCRGANSAAELARQRDKIVSALAEIDADIVGLIEIENNAAESLIDLVGGLNAVVGADTYDYVDTGTIGGDAIKVAFIYKPDTVDLAGDPAILDSSVDSTFIDTKNRPVLIQTFDERATGERLTIAVNHLKSKGSSCAGDPIPDPDLDDGQANCNLTRTTAATALVNHLATDPTGSGDPDFLIIGDLNAYAMEDPIAAITGAGYTDLINAFGGSDAYSFVFDGQLGYLDHALANEALLPSVTGVTEWHINADEVNVLDYNDDIRDPGEASFERKSGALPIYETNGFRSSDHDPLIVGLDLATARGLKESAHDELADLLPARRWLDDWFIRVAIRRIDQSLNPHWWIDDDTLDPKRGKKVFDREFQAATVLGFVKAADVQPAVDKLIDADRRLATTQLGIAVDAGADDGDIAKVQHLIATAESYVAHGRYPKAILKFRDAWRAAVKATPEPPVRFATFNASLNRPNAGQLANELSAPGSDQPDVIAEIIQRNRPEVLLINEFDYDEGNVALEGFHENYLMVPHGDADPIEYPYRYTAPSNTGIFSGYDLDNSGAAGDFVPGDSFGFGFFEGQFGMAVYSMHPIDVDDIRTFQNFLWKDMPGALLPVDPVTGVPWYTDEELEVVRLSSKSHWDVPIDIDGERVHFLVSHPTPPVFDGPEDRNGTRNSDEIRFWADYVNGGYHAKYIYDDQGKKGGLKYKANFVIAGDQNSDPFDGDSRPGAIQQLLDHPRVNTAVTPSSLGGVEQALLQGGINDDHLSDPAFDTADFSDSAPGNLRADYVLPSNNLPIRDAGVFWPLESDPLFSLVGTFPFPSSDHRLVWVDVGLDG